MSHEEKFRRIAGFAGLFAAALGLLGLAGWLLDWTWLRNIQADPVRVDPGIALGLLIGGTALRLQRDGRNRSLVIACAVLILAVIIPGVAETLLSPLGSSEARHAEGAIDRPADSLASGQLQPSNVALIAVAIALFLLTLGRNGNRRPMSIWLGIFVLSVASGNLFASGFTVEVAAGGFNPMAGALAVGLLVLGAGVICARPDHHVVRTLTDRTAIGALVRRLLLVVLLLPVSLSVLLAIMPGRHEVDHSSTLALISISYILLGLVVVVLSAEAAVKLDESREAAEQQSVRLTALLQEQAARLQETVGLRTFELRAAAADNARLALVARQTTNAVIITDTVGRVEWVNPAFERLTGYSLQEMMGQKPGAVLQGPETSRAAAAELSRAVRGGASCSVEILNYTKSGRSYWQLVSIQPLCDETGRIMNFISIQVDVSALRRGEERRRQLAQRLQLAARSAALGIWEWDATTQLTTWDERTLGIYGLAEADYHGTAVEWERRLHPEDRARALAARVTITSGTSEQAQTFRIIRPDGAVRHIESRVVTERDAAGRFIRVVGTDRDITAEREAAEQLTRSNERLDLALRSARFGVWELELATYRHSWNDRMLEIHGLRREEFDETQERWLRCLHPDDRTAEERLVARVIRGETASYDSEYRIVWPDGSEHFIESRGCLQRDALGSPRRLVGLCRDITERHELETRLRQAEELSAESSRLARVGGWEIDHLNSRVTWSGDTRRIHEVDDDYQPTLATVFDYFPAEARVTIEAALQETGATNLTMDLEVPLITAKGRHRWVRMIGRTILSAGHRVRTYGAIQDVTANHESEETRRRLEAQLFQIQKIDTVGTLAGGIAHDFNNLLTGIIGYQELITEMLDKNHPALAFLGEARNASLRARDLVEQILTFSRQSDGAEHTPLDLGPVIEEAHRFMRATIPAQIAIEVQLDESCGQVLADATQIHQVLMNLGSNAAQAILPDGGTIRISLQVARLRPGRDAALLGVPPGDYARIVFSDTGRGMDAATQQRIFDPFFTTKKAGTGLGLAVAHGIIRAHHGVISVESAPGKGTRFEIHLPTCDTGAPPSAEPQAEGPPRGAGELVCVVDDEELVGRFTQLALESLGYEVVAFSTAQAALDYLRHDSAGCSLLLTDQTMPGMQGHELAVAVRAFAPSLPIAIMSGYISRPAPQMFAPIGQVELLAKPFTGQELALAVRRAMQPAPDDAARA